MTANFWRCACGEPNAMGLKWCSCGRPKDASAKPAIAEHSPRPEVKKKRKELLENKWEKDWFAVLQAGGVQQLQPKAITLRLGDDCRYTPDIFGVPIEGPTVWEVKGHMRPQARVKLMSAANKYPWLRFILVTKPDGQWIEEVIRP